MLFINRAVIARRLRAAGAAAVLSASLAVAGPLAATPAATPAVSPTAQPPVGDCLDWCNTFTGSGASALSSR